MDRTRARQLAADFVRRGRATDWFEVLYAEARAGTATVPWADLVPNPAFAEWLTEHGTPGGGRRALVVGCGLGDDVEWAASHGYDAVGFDVSATAVEWCRRRFPAQADRFVVADVLAPPAAWSGAFDLVLEAYTLQVLPPAERAAATACIAGCVAPGGLLVVVARAREATDDPGSMPWPLLRGEVLAFARHGLVLDELRDYVDDEDPPVRRFRGVFRRLGTKRP